MFVLCSCHYDYICVPIAYSWNLTVVLHDTATAYTSIHIDKNCHTVQPTKS